MKYRGVVLTGHEKEIAANYMSIGISLGMMLMIAVMVLDMVL